MEVILSFETKDEYVAAFSEKFLGIFWEHMWMEHKKEGEEKHSLNFDR